MKYIPGNAQHIGAREEQQDAFGFSDPRNQPFMAHGGLLGVIADGMGGMALGSAASKTAVSTFLQSYGAKTRAESIPCALKRALREANCAVRRLATEAGLDDEVGTTLAAVVVVEDSLHWISAGDSRIYLWRADEVTQLTTDHVYANELAEAVAQGRITRTEAFADPEREALTSYLGLKELQEIDANLRPFPLEAGDRILLCTDGLYRTLSEAEIAASIPGDPQELCETLVEKALAKEQPRQDNVTLLTFSCQAGQLVTARAAKPDALRTWLIALAALLVLTGAAAGLWYWLKPAPPKVEQPQAPPVLESVDPDQLTPTPAPGKPKKKKAEASKPKKPNDRQRPPKSR